MLVVFPWLVDVSISVLVILTFFARDSPSRTMKSHCLRAEKIQQIAKNTQFFGLKLKPPQVSNAQP